MAGEGVWNSQDIICMIADILSMKSTTLSGIWHIASVCRASRDALEKWLLNYKTRIEKGLNSGLCALFQDRLDTMLDWMAHMLQHPEVKPKKGIILVGSNGKAHYLEVLKALIGGERLFVTNTLIKRYQTGLDGSILVALSGSNIILKELAIVKKFISDTRIMIDRNRNFREFIRSHHRVLLATHTPLPPFLKHSNDFHKYFTVIPCGMVDELVFSAAINDGEQIASLCKSLMERDISVEF
jgi:hypothetical protein